LRFVAGISTIDKGKFDPGTFLTDGFEQSRQGIAILNVGGADLALDR
jgi:hypothetical protein